MDFSIQQVKQKIYQNLTFYQENDKMSSTRL